MKNTDVKPLGENVLIHPLKPEQKTSAGIYIPDTASQERSQMGEVIGIGEGVKFKLKAGQKVIFKRYGGEEVKIDGEEYLLATYKDILAVVK